MQITNFQSTGLKEFIKWSKEEKVEFLEKKPLKELLKNVNISFVAENINRLQSMLLCELKDSYIQQSQRYVNMKDNPYTLPELDKKDKEKAKRLIDESFYLYHQMSETKSKVKGRPKKKDYKHGIPIEDARYILPLATKTNIAITLSGDKLVGLFDLLLGVKYREIFKEFFIELKKNLPQKLINMFFHVLPNEQANSQINQAYQNKINSFYEENLNKINENDNLVLLDSFKNPEIEVGIRTTTSTSSKAPSEKNKEWKNKEKEESNKLIEKVLGYGHESIIEQQRTIFGQMMSLTAYHQQIRHRLPKYHREELEILLTKEGSFQRIPKVPPTIKNTKFEEKFIELAHEIQEFRLYIANKYNMNKALYFLLNCEQIKLTVSTNARIDIEMLSERTCRNAQWEIRNLATKKAKNLMQLSKTIYQNALPPCLIDECPEGELSCGEYKKVKETFKEEVAN